MANKYTPDEDVRVFAVKLQRQARKSKNLAGLIKALTVALGAEGLNTDRTAAVLQLSRATVIRYRQEIALEARGEILPKPGSGGRRNCLMTREEEIAFIAGWKEAALRGEAVTAGKIHKDLCKIAGRQVAATTAARLLHRHGWTKLKPRSRNRKKRS
jgi:transposase